MSGWIPPIAVVTTRICYGKLITEAEYTAKVIVIDRSMNVSSKPTLNALRCALRVELVFAQQTQRLIRTICLDRATVKISMMNLVYNMCRLA